MTFRLWIIAAVAFVVGGIAAIIGQSYVPLKPGIQVTFPENSCAIRCPVQTAYAATDASVTCMAGTAPLCQCTDASKQQASCVPAN